MEKSNIIIRLMDIADINKVSAIHSECFPTSRSTRLGMPFVRRMYQWYVLDQPGLSFVAILNEEIVGFVAGVVATSVGHEPKCKIRRIGHRYIADGGRVVRPRRTIGRIVLDYGNAVGFRHAPSRLTVGQSGEIKRALAA